MNEDNPRGKKCKKQGGKKEKQRLMGANSMEAARKTQKREKMD